MLYDRSYMKTPSNLFNRSICDQLIILLISCFLLQAILSLFYTPQLINQTFAFGLYNLTNGCLWTPLTYGLIHDGPLHLLVNLLGIHFIPKQFLKKLKSPLPLPQPCHTLSKKCQQTNRKQILIPTKTFSLMNLDHQYDNKAKHRKTK